MPTYFIQLSSFNKSVPSLIVEIGQTINGKTWITTVIVNGSQAQTIWDSWGTDNDQAIIAELMAL